MNIGKRIEQRLRSLGWERKDLLERVPDLSAQALSNLIRRDSVRSEWDTAIADALGVSVLWLVYGQENHYSTDQKTSMLSANEPTRGHYLGADEKTVLEGFRVANENDRETIMFLAKRALDTFVERTGTH